MNNRIIPESERLLREKGKFPYNIADQDFLLDLNKSLVTLEMQLLDTKFISEHPNIFILGLPRSGTTLLSQILFNHLSIDCVNNLMARFWDAPLCGAFLSKILLNDTKSNSYVSRYATTHQITDPHEFGYFWRKHFLCHDITSSYPPERVDNINWSNIRAIIYNMNRILGKGLVLKNLEIAGYYLERFLSTFPRSIYIYIERNPLDTASSIAKARQEFYNDLNSWWGIYPLEYAKLKDEPYEKQIAGQIYYLMKMYRENMRRANSERIITVNYEDLCNHPNILLDKIIELNRKLYSYNFDKIGNPEPLSVSSPKIDAKILNKLKIGLEAFDIK
jgi:hypothetical protein